MVQIKLTKNELRLQQNRLNQLEKYLPTLQLKKAMLQAEVSDARQEIIKCEEGFKSAHSEIERFSALLSDSLTVDLNESAKISKVFKHTENIAGVEVPYFDSLEFEDFSYSLFETPAWTDSAIKALRKLAENKVRVEIAREKKTALEKELREVAIRVNLFEKILIPRALANIKKIRVFLGDLQLAAVSQAKAAKTKIEERKKLLSETPGQYAI